MDREAGDPGAGDLQRSGDGVRSYGSGGVRPYGSGGVRSYGSGGARSYRSARRTRAAADTRAAILAAAMRLFLERGYGRVTVSDIAQAAGTAVPTVYASTGGKSAILATVIDEAVRDPVVDETLAAIRASRNPRQVIRVTAHGVRIDNERYHDMIRVLLAAAAIDDSAADILARSNRTYRDTLAKTTDRLRELDALEPDLTPERATDILWFYFGHRAWLLYVSERGWSWDEAESWLARRASMALLRTGRRR